MSQDTPARRFDPEEPADCGYCSNRAFCTPDKDGDPICQECRDNPPAFCSNCGRILFGDEVEFCGLAACQEIAKTYNPPKEPH